MAWPMIARGRIANAPTQAPCSQRGRRCQAAPPWKSVVNGVRSYNASASEATAYKANAATTPLAAIRGVDGSTSSARTRTNAARRTAAAVTTVSTVAVGCSIIRTPSVNPPGSHADPASTRKKHPTDHEAAPGQPHFFAASALGHQSHTLAATRTRAGTAIHRRNEDPLHHVSMATSASARSATIARLAQPADARPDPRGAAAPLVPPLASPPMLSLLGLSFDACLAWHDAQPAGAPSADACPMR